MLLRTKPLSGQTKLALPDSNRERERENGTLSHYTSARLRARRPTRRRCSDSITNEKWPGRQRVLVCVYDRSCGRWRFGLQYAEISSCVLLGIPWPANLRARRDIPWCAIIRKHPIRLSFSRLFYRRFFLVARIMSVETKSPIHCLQFSPFAASSNLLALGGRSGVTIKSCSLPVRPLLLQIRSDFLLIPVTLPPKL